MEGPQAPFCGPVEQLHGASDPDFFTDCCAKTALEMQSSTATPITLDKGYAAGLKVGVAASFVRNTDGKAYPIAIYADRKRSKLVGAFGVTY